MDDRCPRERKAARSETVEEKNDGPDESVFIQTQRQQYTVQKVRDESAILSEASNMAMAKMVF